MILCSFFRNWLGKQCIWLCEQGRTVKRQWTTMTGQVVQPTNTTVTTTENKMWEGLWDPKKTFKLIYVCSKKYCLRQHVRWKCQCERGSKAFFYCCCLVFVCFFVFFLESCSSSSLQKRKGETRTWWKEDYKLFTWHLRSQIVKESSSNV